MISTDQQQIAVRATEVYKQLQAHLEARHRNQFVAIEPDSGDYFLADTFSAAVARSREAHPDRLAFVIRIGHDSAVHLGGISN